jgi:hypothetical protein
VKLLAKLKRVFRKREGDPKFRKGAENLDAFGDNTFPTNYVRSYDEGRPRK